MKVVHSLLYCVDHDDWIKVGVGMRMALNRVVSTMNLGFVYTASEKELYIRIVFLYWLEIDYKH